MSIEGTDLVPIAQQMLAQAQQGADDAHLWMNLSTVMLCLGQKELGLGMQQQALQMQGVYVWPARQQPASCRVLMLMVPGEISANTPLDCLLEESDVELIHYFLSPQTTDPSQLFTHDLPAHDVVLVSMAESDENRGLLNALQTALANWPQPVMNLPAYVPRTGRDAASALLHNIDGLLMPPTHRTHRNRLQALANGQAQVDDLAVGCNLGWPLIVRPLDSHAGRDLARIANADELVTYLQQVKDEDFFFSQFIDYRSADGLFRKYRIALIDGVPYACHMAISSHWMIHYVNAGMYDDAHKREEEAAFMQHFTQAGQFANRHAAALSEINRRVGLDYLCLDCAETLDGQLFIFEIDHTMVAHAMDPAELFPYKQVHMATVRDAFRAALLQRMSAAA